MYYGFYRRESAHYSLAHKYIQGGVDLSKIWLNFMPNEIWSCKKIYRPGLEPVIFELWVMCRDHRDRHASLIPRITGILVLWNRRRRVLHRDAFASCAVTLLLFSAPVITTNRSDYGNEQPTSAVVQTSQARHTTSLSDVSNRQDITNQYYNTMQQRHTSTISLDHYSEISQKSQEDVDYEPYDHLDKDAMQVMVVRPEPVYSTIQEVSGADGHAEAVGLQ